MLVVFSIVKRGFHPEHFGRLSLQLIYGVILTINVIADLGLHHGIEHGFGGSSYSVTAKIDHYSYAVSIA